MFFSKAIVILSLTSLSVSEVSAKLRGSAKPEQITTKESSPAAAAAASVQRETAKVVGTKIWLYGSGSSCLVVHDNNNNFLSLSTPCDESGFPNEFYYSAGAIKTPAMPDYCLDWRHDLEYIDNNVRMNVCNGAKSQQWKFFSDGSTLNIYPLYDSYGNYQDDSSCLTLYVDGFDSDQAVKVGDCNSVGGHGSESSFTTYGDLFEQPSLEFEEENNIDVPSSFPSTTPSPTPVPRPTQPTTQGQFFTQTKWEFCFDCSHPDVVLYNEQATEDNIMVEWMNAHGQPYADRDILGGCSGQKCISKTIDSPEGESISVKLTIQGDDAVVIDHATLKKNDSVSQQFGEHGGTAYCLSKNSDDNKWFKDFWHNTVSGRCSEAISFVNGEINNLHEGK